MKLVSLIIAAITLSGLANAATFEINDMKQILPYVQKNTLVIFDIDNTILRPVQTLGSDQWYSYEVKKLVSSGANETQAIETVIRPWIQVQKKTAVMAVQPLTPLIIQSLRRNEISVMALTSRPVELTDTTLSQLKSISAEIPFNPYAKNGFIVGGDASTLFARGILFVGPKNVKGMILRQFLQENRVKPSRIIFVDDKAKHVQSVETALLGTGIEYFGFRYGAADPIVQNFDSKIADRQLQIFQSSGELISDQAAAKSSLQQ